VGTLGKACAERKCTPRRIDSRDGAPSRSRLMSGPKQSPELAAALEAASAAESIIRALYRPNLGRDLAVTTKPDDSPVTEADVRAEQAIRAVLERHFPGYGFYGEEGGAHGMGAENIWLVDPIDGTKSFVRACPFFSTQIALLRAGRLVLGVSSAGVYGELAWAQAGAGAYLNGARVKVSEVSELAAAIVSSGNLKSLAASPAWSRFGTLIPRISRLRGYGDFVHYHLLARGALDVVIESDVNILDIAALSVIVGEAGGVFTDLRGAPVSLDTTSVLASNGRLHERVRDALRY
jgi:histidinol-phosphatase